MNESALTSGQRDALARLIEGEAEPADEILLEAAIRANPALLDVVREQLGIDSLLSQEATSAEEFVDSVRERLNAEADASAFEERVASALPRASTARKSGTWLPFAAGMALLLAVAVWWASPRPDQTVVALAQVSGVVSWSSEDGAWKSALADGAQLAGGTISVEGETSSAVLVFRDDTRVTLTGNSELTFSDHGQKRLRCARGSLSASVAAQPKGRPMMVRTPTAEIEVLGTVFTVDAEAATTSIAVERGSVRVRRIDDPTTANLAAEQVMVVTAESLIPLAPRNAPAAPSQWRASLEAPLDERWSGAWLPPGAGEPKRIVAVPLLVGAKQKFLKPGVKVMLEDFDGYAGGISISARSVLRLRVRSLEDDALDIFVNTTSPGGAFAGNFQRIVSVRSGAVDANGWSALEVDFGSLPAVSIFQEQFPSPLGARAKFLLLTSTASFEISALEIVER